LHGQKRARCQHQQQNDGQDRPKVPQPVQVTGQAEVYVFCPEG
jgi:hypothetical protein